MVTHQIVNCISESRVRMSIVSNIFQYTHEWNDYSLWSDILKWKWNSKTVLNTLLSADDQVFLLDSEHDLLCTTLQIVCNESISTKI
jgi:hypothetical protein